jgi:cytochrome c biogenesis factor
MIALGPVLLGAALLASLVAIALLVFGHLAGPKDGETVTNWGYFITFGSFVLVTMGTLLLLVALLTKNFSFMYVVENHSRDVSSLSWLYSFSALWAGREGSLLFWAWLLSLFTAFMAWRRISVTDAVSNLGIAVMNFVQVFFLVALFFDTNNPFKATPASYLSGGKLVGQAALMGMNPLLQHWAMILHPPTLFIGYAGLTVPFAFAMGALFAKDSSKDWVDIVGRVTVFSWLTLGIGIGLGAIWAYAVLGWGGYWAWDPVENASLLPWLVGVGLLHSFTVYRRRGAFKKWAVMMSAVTFVLVLLGTFITRSGVIQSVHGFGADNLSLWWFLGMMLLSLAAPAAMLIWRGDLFKGNDEFTSLLSKEGSYYFNNLLMVFAALLVAGLTLSPALNIWNPGGATVTDYLSATSAPTSASSVEGYVVAGSLETTAGQSTLTLNSAIDGSGDSMSVSAASVPAGTADGSPIVVTGTMQNGTFVASSVVTPKLIKGPTFSGPSFDLLARPIGILYVLLMTICPILSWGATGTAAFWKRAKWPLVGGGVLGAGLLVIWATSLLPYYQSSGKGLGALASIQAPLDHIEAVVGLVIAGFAIALPIYLFIDGSRKRAAARGENPLVAFGNIVFKSRSQSGGYIAHLGIGIVLIGLIGSSMYVMDSQFTMPNQIGASQTVGGYTLTFKGVQDQTLSNGDVESKVTVDLSKGGVLVETLQPMVTQLANRATGQTSTLNAAVHSELLRDVFVAFQNGDASGLTFDVKINPMISWAWAGFILLIIGTGIASWPRKETDVAPVRSPGKKKAV